MHKYASFCSVPATRKHGTAPVLHIARREDEFYKPAVGALQVDEETTSPTAKARIVHARRLLPADAR